MVGSRAAKVCVVLDEDSGDEAIYIRGKLLSIHSDGIYPVDLERELKEAGLDGKPIIFSRMEIDMASEFDDHNFPAFLSDLIKKYNSGNEV
jgi:hypothetical protein